MQCMLLDGHLPPMTDGEYNDTSRTNRPAHPGHTRTVRGRCSMLARLRRVRFRFLTERHTNHSQDTAATISVPKRNWLSPGGRPQSDIHNHRHQPRLAATWYSHRRFQVRTHTAHHTQSPFTRGLTVRTDSYERLDYRTSSATVTFVSNHRSNVRVSCFQSREPSTMTATVRLSPSIGTLKTESAV